MGSFCRFFLAQISPLSSVTQDFESVFNDGMNDMPNVVCALVMLVGLEAHGLGMLLKRELQEEPGYEYQLEPRQEVALPNPVDFDNGLFVPTEFC
ncbi:MAG: hypothetical protein EP323_01680 [Gammaproteobacteria bacterium]|nr:MAG: hypothetical protein EP323_01680 [Gammaproteobacteria bacterium]